uniref:Uncharacterized protein n=1 Tax=Globisporangium ultimum (strain ATCC 200006 / CBS 805.95 / DAOM BR144) TaxID=431595 RepID=K3X6E0_GLOUD
MQRTYRTWIHDYQPAMAEYNDPKEPFKWTLFDPTQRQKMSEWASPVSIRCSSLGLCLSDHTQASIG